MRDEQETPTATVVLKVFYFHFEWMTSALTFFFFLHTQDKSACLWPRVSMIYGVSETMCPWTFLIFWFSGKPEMMQSLLDLCHDCLTHLLVSFTSNPLSYGSPSPSRSTQQIHCNIQNRVRGAWSKWKWHTIYPSGFSPVTSGQFHCRAAPHLRLPAATREKLLLFKDQSYQSMEIHEEGN